VPHRPYRKFVHSVSPVRAGIASFAHDGRGVAHADGKAVFVDGALPGEEVTFTYTEMHRDYAEAKVQQVITPSPQRAEPLCAHFGVCGGCSLQHLAAEAQIIHKQNVLQEQLKRIGKVEPTELWPPLTGPYWGYRRKARLAVKYVAKKGRVLAGFREKTSPLIAELRSCAVLHPQIGAHLLDLAELIALLDIKDRLPQIEVAIGEHRSALVFRVLADAVENDLQRLRGFGERFGFDIYLQRHGPESVVALYPEEPPLLTYSLPNQGVDFEFKPTDFTQVNAEINRGMVDRVVEILEPDPGDGVLDLFCGLGNFTLPIARRAGMVVGVDGSRELVQRGLLNATRNGIENVRFHAADLTQPLDEEIWARRRYSKVVMDPSRAGAADVLTWMTLWNAWRIVYVSCNPATLARDAGLLVHRHGYRLLKAGVMDMFPHTAHVESIALFEK
jgi:23S rRNA (uracil1939-C5)-methyltransferase